MEEKRLIAGCDIHMQQMKWEKERLNIEVSSSHNSLLHNKSSKENKYIHSRICVPIFNPEIEEWEIWSIRF